MELPAYSNGVTLGLKELLFYKQQCVAWLPPARSLWSTMAGQHQSRKLGRGMDFSEVRQYQAGDDIRTIDWRVTARTGKPHTKLFSEEREKPVVIYVDLSANMHMGSRLLLKSVQAAHIAALISWLSFTQKDRIGALIDLGDRQIEIKPKSHQSGILTMLQKMIEGQAEILQQTNRNEVNSMAESLVALNRLAPKGSEVIVISDYTRYHDDMTSLFNQLRQHNLVRLIQIYDPLERGETSFRGVESVSDSRQTRWLNFSAGKTRSGIKKAFETQKDRLELLSRTQGIPYTQLSCGLPLLTQLSGKF
ncbi:hypothetical protein VA7868_03761 [Vibrio aerogenes CECT 7868]|uniref:DUF58 domain-containing protein n=1 Tax=Vibrio aerogenes CECT 7868 TaxID=1216006 RepID=A0A1M6BCW6_9VIBR|nr:DUF58 domain-containing protein [Vibrio aerogenes]SHI46555.1 hypothetical protein VA7868_03761 [Vibrio aerogenes CECT 7868]